MQNAITESKIISDADLKKLLDRSNEAKNKAITSKTNLIHIQDHFMFAICYGTALRVDELRCLKWIDFLEDSAVLRVRKGKGLKARDIDLGSNVLRKIRLFKKLSTQILKRRCDKDDFLFLSTKGGYYRDRSGMWRRFKYWQERSEMNNQKLSFHSLRHKWSTTALNGGVNLKRVSLNLGHSKVSTTLDLYYHLTEDSKQKIKELF